VTPLSYIFFFIDTATPKIYTLSLHDALPISSPSSKREHARRREAKERSYSVRPFTSRSTTSAIAREPPASGRRSSPARRTTGRRSEEHTSELQSLAYLVCRLLLEKKKEKNNT